jgi:hypothetical protein
VVGPLVHNGIPHLAVRVRDGIGIVGPLALPGRSSCLTCADLHRTDSRWPMIAGELAGGRSEPTSVTCRPVLLAAAQALRLSPEASPPPVWSATLEIDSYDGAVRQRWWPVHPRCGCGAR